MNIEKYGGKSVVPVTCGCSTGTAFYIGERRFLTAWHVVAEAETPGESISLLIEGETKYCRLDKLEDMDAALLTCTSDIPDITPIELLKTDFRDDEFEIIGYPQELGNGIDYFGVSVKNLKELSNHDRGFDVMVMRTDPFGFHSYSGFSGSPVLNKKGVAVGIVTDQLYNTLGYTSIQSIADKLTEKHVSYFEDADRYDMRDIGVGTCEELAEKACQKMQSRYSKKNHVEDKDLETKLQVFCGYDTDRWKKQARKKLNEWYQDVGTTIQTAVSKLNVLNSYMAGVDVDNYELAIDMEFLLNKRIKENSDNYFVTGDFRKRLLEISSLMDASQEAEMLEKKHFMYVHGDAGNGKTQHMCYFTQVISQYRNVYLLFGTDFETGKAPGLSIREALGWNDEHIFAKLNDEMVQRGRYATFIIDALNEGEGTFMWHTLLPNLKAEIDNYPRLKLIVTVRTMERGDQLQEQFKSGWEEVEINGFSNLREAITKYFGDSHIYENAESYLYVKEFQHPLFLKIFCHVYHRLPAQYRKEPDIIYLYQLYYMSRNDEVSRLADEDPVQMVTLNIMQAFGYMSWQRHLCCDLPREDALKVANEMCPNRLWSNNLYHALVTSNLLMEYRQKDGHKTSFQYDSMGDYTRVLSMMIASGYNDEVLLNYLLELADIINNAETGHNERKHIINTVKVLLSAWNPSEEIWHREAFMNGKLTQLLLESLKMRNMKARNSTLPEDMVANLVLGKDELVNPEYLLANFTLYRDHLMEPVHDRLMRMSMLERDEQWTLNVNRMQDDYSYFFKIRQMELEPNEENARAYIRILCWLTSTSHPQLRNHIRRVVATWLREYSGLCKELVEKFCLCNDPYILRSVFSAVYGVLLVKRDKVFTHEVAEAVFANLYADQPHVPTEIEVRSWTLKILEYNHLLNPADGYWEGAKPPYNRTENLMAIPEGEDFEDESYFGDGNGAKKMHHSLFDWDFNRYILGTNSNRENGSRTYLKDGKGVDLGAVANAIAYRIKHVYGYSQTLSDYDEGVRWDDRTRRQTERMGKKYQWIALGEVKAYLSDTCQMKKNWWNDKSIAEVPYPWYDSNTVTFEPTLTMTGNRSYMDQTLFKEVDSEDLMVGETHEWLKDKKRVPKPIVIVNSKDGREWVNIVGYQKKVQEENGDKRESFVFICPCMVRRENADAFEQWAKDQCFYGRWMPEDSGHYEYFWNEFPWSDSYKSLEFEEESEIFGHGVAAPCNVILPYASQLQEYYEGIDDEEEYEGMIYMPSAEMFEYFGWHTAERGVTRDEEGNVVSLCRNLQGDLLDTLVIRRDLLNQYLDAKGLVLFYCMLAEKRLKQEPQQYFMQRLSSCYKYVPDGEPIVVQPMTDEEDFPKPEYNDNNDDMIEGISPELWLQIEQEGGGEKLKYLLKDYEKMMEEREKEKKENDGQNVNHEG